MREWIYGRYPVLEVLRVGHRNYFQLNVLDGAQEKGVLRDIIAICEARGIVVKRVPKYLLDKINPNHQGVVLEASEYSFAYMHDILQLARDRNEQPFILLLDSLQDPQNFGTLLRTAVAVGVHGVIIPKQRSVKITPAVVNASSGAAEHILISQMNLANTIDELQKENVWVIGLEYSMDAAFAQNVRLDGAVALVVGSEGEGLRRLVREKCDVLMKLPMRGEVGSLNAATAGSVALYLAWQARSYAGGAEN